MAIQMIMPLTDSICSKHAAKMSTDEFEESETDTGYFCLLGTFQTNQLQTLRNAKFRCDIMCCLPN
jgi:hypothetical protein